MFLARQRDPDTRELADVAVRLSYEAGSGIRLEIGEPPTEPLEPLDDYRQKVLRASSRGTVYPYELTGLLAGDGGSFTEYDLDGDGAWCRPTGRAARTPRRWWPAWSARRPRCTRRA